MNNIKILNTLKCLCPSCMEEHDVSIVEIEETCIVRGEQLNYLAHYHYCKKADEFYETEDQISSNYASMKTAYRVKLGLLTSNDI